MDIQRNQKFRISKANTSQALKNASAPFKPWKLPVHKPDSCRTIGCTAEAMHYNRYCRSHRCAQKFENRRCNNGLEGGPGIDLKKYLPSYYCDLHGCKANDNMKRSGDSSYCADHKCRSRDRKRRAIVTVYCEGCACAVDRCPYENSLDSDYCKEYHQCLKFDYARRRKRGSQHCQWHFDDDQSGSEPDHELIERSLTEPWHGA